MTGCYGFASAGVVMTGLLEISAVRVRRVLPFCAGALMAATLAACPQSTGVAGKPPSMAIREASLQPAPTGSFVAKRRVLIAHKRHAPFATAKSSSEKPSSGVASYYGHGSQTA